MSNPFDGLTAIVRYRRKDGGPWHNMAAFDLLSIAEKYAADCSGKNMPWEYEAVEVPASDKNCT